MGEYGGGQALLIAMHECLPEELTIGENGSFLKGGWVTVYVLENRIKNYRSRFLQTKKNYSILWILIIICDLKKKYLILGEKKIYISEHILMLLYNNKKC